MCKWSKPSQPRIEISIWQHWSSLRSWRSQSTGFLVPKCKMWFTMIIRLRLLSMQRSSSGLYHWMNWVITSGFIIQARWIWRGRFTPTPRSIRWSRSGCWTSSGQRSGRRSGRAARTQRSRFGLRTTSSRLSTAFRAISSVSSWRSISSRSLTLGSRWTSTIRLSSGDLSTR
jgi:hypothetical protein